MKLRHASLAALILLSGCTTLSGQLRERLGTDVSNAIMDNGAPTQTADLPNGLRAYTWVQRRGGIECWITLTADQSGTVRAYSYRNCPTPMDQPNGSGRL